MKRFNFDDRSGQQKSRQRRPSDFYGAGAFRHAANSAKVILGIDRQRKTGDK